MHVFKPALFDFLEIAINENLNGEEPIQLTPFQQKLASTDKYLALEMKGTRYDTSKKLGLMQAQLALGIAGSLKDEVLSSIIEILAESGKRS